MPPQERRTVNGSTIASTAPDTDANGFDASVRAGPQFADKRLNGVDHGVRVRVVETQSRFRVLVGANVDKHRESLVAGELYANEPVIACGGNKWPRRASGAFGPQLRLFLDKARG